MDERETLSEIWRHMAETNSFKAAGYQLCTLVTADLAHDVTAGPGGGVLLRWNLRPPGHAALLVSSWTSDQIRSCQNPPRVSNPFETSCAVNPETMSRFRVG